MHRPPPRRGFGESLTRSFGTLACQTMPSSSTSVGFGMADLSSSSKGSCTNVVGRVVAGEGTRVTRELYHGQKGIPQRPDRRRNAV
jgi:hypothetical protein